MSSRAKITFVGPVERIPRVGGVSFVLVQGKGTSLKLEYATRAAAVNARKQVLTGPMTYAISRLAVLDAIQAALACASSDTKPQTEQPEG